MLTLRSQSLGLFVSLFLVTAELAIGFELPFLGSCSISDEKCQREYTEKFFEMYRHGIPELDIPTFDPMNLGDIAINGNTNANFNFELTMHDVKLYKYSNVKCLGVKGFSRDTSKPMRVVIKILSPELIIRTQCKMKGKVLLFNVEGDTDLEIYITNLTTIMNTVAESYMKDSSAYFKVTEFKPKLNIGSLKTKFSNSTLFNGDQVIMDSFAYTINENWMVLRDEIQPRLEEANSKISIIILNKILATMPVDRIFKNE